MIRAVENAIDFFRNMKVPLKELKWNLDLHEAAQYHVLDTGAKGLLGHDGSSGATVEKRTKQFLKKSEVMFASENLSYGY